MTLPSIIIVIAWIVFLSYWVTTALYAKKNIHFWRWFSLRLVMIALLFIFFHSQVFQKLEGYHLVMAGNQFWACIGALLTITGITFAVWARYHLGKNWGMPMSIKENPELVTSGPYTYVRHPIYAGILLAILGSTLTGNLGWLIVFLIIAIFFILSARKEEALMREKFPTEYGSYMKRTKMIIPYLY